MAAIRRVRDGWPLEFYDRDMIVPLLESCLGDHVVGDIRFAQVGRKFVVDTTEFRNLLGFHYLQAILGERGHSIAATKLSPVVTTFEFVPMTDRPTVKTQVDRKKKIVGELKWLRFESGSDNTEYEFQLAEELLLIETELNRTTYQGRIKHHRNDYDRNKQAVARCIRRAIQALLDNDATAHIGYHLDKHIKTGGLCSYSGDWQWIF